MTRIRLICVEKGRQCAMTHQDATSTIRKQQIYWNKIRNGLEQRRNHQAQMKSSEDL